MTKKILIVDDESSIRDVCKRYLQREGYLTIEASDGEEAIAKWKKQKPDLVILDLMMPYKTGWEVCQEIREVDDVPIIMLTARGEEQERLMGLTNGAEDYVTKPFSPRELVLRVKSIFRLLGRNPLLMENREEKVKLVQYGELEVNEVTRTVYLSQNPVELTMKEFDILWLLINHPKQVFSRSQLLDKVWNMEFEGDTTTVTVHMRRLREKLESDPSNPQMLKTVWGVGYKFESGDEE
ncbi:response regulator transcription factor [Bacillus sp. mrc49]|uniref:response regulator transcription factor n=1 Tax=Bacillus sp. mrc49 TaxID=2054913 RepID=UPI000C27EAB2|nr:response regulator transcription factor [Bacillus sp. mrc49]PJN88583.1 DNA-binding response regulator [Bacillus sp. mrc49]